MPNAPTDVYIEDLSTGPPPITGVATATAGFVGQCRTGPVTGAPTLVTNYSEFLGAFGDDADLVLGGATHTNHLAHAVRLFFINGGKRVYVARVIGGANNTSAASDDTDVASPSHYIGSGSGDIATGLAALAEVSEIAIVAAPGAAALTSTDDHSAVNDALIRHCEELKYRFAILAVAQDADVNAVRTMRAHYDTKFAALYSPWLFAKSSTTSSAVALSPEGAIAGVYARIDIARGVHAAPTNSPLRGVLRLSRDISKRELDALNTEGVNSLRTLASRGTRVWGNRTLSSDPDWKYVSVRRLFTYVEYAVDVGTQWVIFEPNGDQLWQRVRQTIESFLFNLWSVGALLGDRPEKAFFVRCDRTTMTQSDIDSGRLICEIGIAPIKPAEFVIIRIGQWTASASTP